MDITPTSPFFEREELPIEFKLTTMMQGLRGNILETNGELERIARGNHDRVKSSD